MWLCVRVRGCCGKVLMERLVSATLMCPAELQSQGREWDGQGVLTIVPCVCVCVEGSCDPQSEPLTNEPFGLKFGIVNAV